MRRCGASSIDENAVLAEIAGAEFTVNYARLYWSVFENCFMSTVRHTL